MVDGCFSGNRSKSCWRKWQASIDCAECLGPVSLTALGVGAIIGAGIFAITGRVAAEDAGPGIMISFVIAGFACAFAALCYAEFAAMAPVAGSAYTYTYATLGEVWAWIIGWDLVLEYAMSCSVVASHWASYFNEFSESQLLRCCTSRALAIIPEFLSDPFTQRSHGHQFVAHPICNLPAIIIMGLDHGRSGHRASAKARRPTRCWSSSRWASSCS